MPQATLADAFSDLCRRAASGPDGLPDAELLRRYAEARDPAAFAALVRRHGRVVWGAALRRTADRQAAEDVFQATFLTLARRAGRLHGQTSLAGWLYTVGVRLARRAARRARPAALEHEVPDRHAGPLDTLSARELLGAIDDELTRLPDRLRLPVVLCCLDGLSRDEAAGRLGCSFQVLKGRLERGRDLLRKRLARRGVSLPAALGGLVVLPAAVPPEVIAATASAILGGNVRPSAAALLRTFGVGRGPGLVAVAMAGLLGLGLALTPAGGPPPKPEEKPVAKESEPPAPGEGLAVRVLRDGKPAAGAKVWVQWYRRGQDRTPDPVTAATGPDGLARPVVPADAATYSVFARDADGRIGEERVYPPGYGPPMGGPATVHLLAVGDISGQVRTPDGKPIAGVELEAMQFHRPDQVHEPARPSYLSIPAWLKAEYRAKSDADGRFRVGGVPTGYRAYIQVTTAGFGHGSLVAEAGKPVDLALRPAGTVRLKLTGDAKPAKGLAWGLQNAAPRPAAGGFVPGAHGEFDGSAEAAIANVAPGRYQLNVPPSVKVPVRVVVPAEVTIDSGKATEVAGTVEPLARMTGRVIDADTGKGLAKVTVYVQTRQAEQGQTEHGGYIETDADGKFEAYGLPGRYATVSFNSNFPIPGYGLPDQTNLGAVPPAKLDLARPHTFPDVKLRRTTELRAAVLDEAGKPVPAPTVWTGRLNLGTDGDTVKAKADGTFTIADLDRADQIAPRVRHRDAVNVPTPIEVGKQEGPARITVSPKNACRVRGRVTDAAGKPLAGAKVGVAWHFQGVGRESQYGTSRAVEILTTDADGRYTSGALWPNDSYQVNVSHDGYARGESGQVRGAAGQTHDLGTVRLVASGREVRGIVVGTDGKPVAGVTVFHRDGPVPGEATTQADGTFTLGGMFDTPGFVLAKKDGYQPTSLAARPGGEPVTLTLRKTSEPPAPPPGREGYEAALAKFTRSALEMLWADRDQMGGFERNVFKSMARFDPATARQWRDEERKRSGGKVDLTRLLDEAGRERSLLATAREDIDDALARIPASNQWQRQLLDLGEQLLPIDKAKALRAAEEAAVRARSEAVADRPWPLAKAGDLAVRAGNPAGGKKLLAEAAELAAKFPADERHNYYRSLVAAALGPHDLAAARKLIDGFTDTRQFDRALGLVIGRLARTDPAAAERLLGDFRPGNDYTASHARLTVGFRLAATDPDRAEQVVAGTAEASYRVLGLARLATLVAEKDRPRAWRLIDRAMGLIDADPDGLRSWSNYGGAAAIAGVVAARGRDVGHLDVTGLVARALAHRASRQHDTPKERQEQAVSLAIVLSSADPAAAKWLLAGIAPPAEYAKRAPGEQRDWLFAAALADPEHATAVADAVWTAAKARRGGGAATSGTGLIELLGTLTEPGDRLANVAHWVHIPSVPDEPD